MRRPALDVGNIGVVEARFGAAGLPFIAVISVIALTAVRANFVGADRVRIASVRVAALVYISFAAVSDEARVGTVA